jgi:hypothetical protein
MERLCATPAGPGSNASYRSALARPTAPPQCLQNTGGGRMRPVAKYMARSGAIHRNDVKAASRNTTMNPPINASSCVRRSRNHCNLSGIYPPSTARTYEEFVGAKKHLVRAAPHTGAPRSNPSGKIAESTQWWKRSSGDGVANSAGMTSSVVGR